MAKENKIEKPVMDELASASNDGRGDGGFMTELLEPDDSVLKARGGDIKIYAPVSRDDQVKTTFGTRRAAVTAREWYVEAGGEEKADQDAAEHLRENLAAINFDAATDKMLFGIFHGYAVAEIMWGERDGKVVMDKIQVRDRARFGFGKRGELRLKKQGGMSTQEMPDRKFWTFSVGADHDDNPYGLGLAHWLYWPVFFKRGGMKSWLKFLDKFGQPTAKGSYPKNATQTEKDALLQAARAIQKDAAVIMPEGMTLELIEATRRGTADYGELYDRMNAAISKVVLGQTLTTEQGDKGARALGQVHQDVMETVVKSDADALCYSFNVSVARWLTEWNFPNAAPPSVWRRMTPEPTVEDLAGRDQKIHALGYRPTAQRVKDVFGEGYEPVNQQAAFAAQPGAEFAAPSFVTEQRAAIGADQNEMAAAAETLADSAQGAIDKRIEELLVILDETGDLKLFGERLAEILANDPDSGFTGALQSAGLSAELLGRLRAQKA